MRKAIGIDMGFTEKTDHSAAVVYGDDGSRGYIVEAIRWRRRIEVVALGLAELSKRHPGAQLFTYYSGAEVTALRMMQDPPYSIDIVGIPARYHKAFRAERAAAAWSKGGIAVPAVATWDLVWFMSEVRNFTGAEGDEDDGVDALVAAFDALDDGGTDALIPSFFGKRCM
jgi:predicted phage terminase large subunit-like protein